MDEHARTWLSWQSTTLPRWGSRVRIPSSAPGRRGFEVPPTPFGVTLRVPLSLDLHDTGGDAVSELWGIARFKFHEGQLEEFKRLSAQAMEIVRTKDTGTLQYDVYFNEDQSECVVLERYRDSEAAIEHASNLGDLFGAVLATVTVVHGEILGEPSPELRA